MARGRKSTTGARTKLSDYRHSSEKRANIPPAKIAVEGVMPEELNINEEGLFDGTPNEFEKEASAPMVEVRNLNAYLTRMVQSIRADGLTFLGNKFRKFARVEPLFETGTGSLIHAEGSWEDGDESGQNSVAIAFGPQYGPVSAAQVEELIRASRRYTELVIAGFSFDAEASAVISENPHPKLRIHQAYIRPDINPGMDGLLKETPRSQLFTVFGQPEIAVKQTKDGEWIVTLEGVDIYDPVQNIIRSTGAEKVERPGSPIRTPGRRSPRHSAARQMRRLSMPSRARSPCRSPPESTTALP